MFYQYGDREKEYLKSKDPILGKAIDEIGHIQRKMTPEFFPALIESIIGQQISGKAADTVEARLLTLTGSFTPEAIDFLSEEEIQKCGMTFSKASYIKAATGAVLEGQIKPEELRQMPDEDVIKKLTSLKGIGIWTAEMLMIFSFGRADVISWNDLAIRRGMKKLYGYEELTKEIFQKHRDVYSPYGTVASLYLWALS